MNYPRINQYRHLFAAGRRALFAGTLAAGGLLAGVVAVGSFGVLTLGGAVGWAVAALLCAGCVSGVLMFAAVCVLGSARRPLELARRNRIGADSEDYVTAILRPLCAEGWRLRTSVDWPGVGDIDNALISPDGEVAFAIETKTRRYLREAVGRVYAQAGWLCRRHRCRSGAVPVIVPARARGLERFESEILVVSPERLINALRAAHGAAVAGCS